MCSIRPVKRQAGRKLLILSPFTWWQSPPVVRCPVCTHTLTPETRSHEQSTTDGSEKQLHQKDARDLRQMTYFIELKLSPFIRPRPYRVLKLCAGCLPWYHDGTQWPPKANF